MIAIVDYGAGNLRSVVNAFDAIGQQTRVVRDPAELRDAAAIVLPGVGAFGDGMAQLRARGFVEALNEQVLVRRTPYLGICLGLQLLARESTEHGAHRGLGWIDGVVQRIEPVDDQCRVPHIGWNTVHIHRASRLLEGLDEPVFYFAHSYHVQVAGDASGAVTGTTSHGLAITASLEQGHIFGVQFHPEKSQREGLQVLTNFARLL